MNRRSAQDLQHSVLALSQVDDPFLGAGTAAAFRKGSPLWPDDNKAVVEHFHTTHSNGRRIEEYFYCGPARAEKLPVAFVFDPLADCAMVYSDHHLVENRDTVLRADPDLIPWQDKDDILFSYFEALKSNNLKATMGHFNDKSYFQHSDGSRHNGLDEIRVDFEKMLGDDGIVIKYCRVTDDGTTCVIECYMPNGRPAIAVYERGDRVLNAVRIYL